MSRHDPRVTLQQLRDTLLEAECIDQRLAGGQAFDRRVHLLALERCFEIIGEAVKRLPPDLRARYPEVDWKKVAGARDVVMHAYDCIDHQILRDAVRLHFPALAQTLARMLADLGGELPTEEPPF